MAGQELQHLVPTTKVGRMSPIKEQKSQHAEEAEGNKRSENTTGTGKEAKGLSGGQKKGQQGMRVRIRGGGEGRGHG